MSKLICVKFSKRNKQKKGNKSKPIPAGNKLLVHVTLQLSDVLIIYKSLRLFSTQKLNKKKKKKEKRNSQVAQKGFQVLLISHKIIIQQANFLLDNLRKKA